MLGCFLEHPNIPVAIRFLTFLICVAGMTHAQPQPSFLIGTITDAQTGERLAAANIRVLGTSQGTVANAEGRYRLVLADGTYRIVFSSLGYSPDTATVAVRGSTTYNTVLKPGDIVLPEVVVSAEDPAIAIMRQVIANKKKWADRLNTYEFDAFTRQVLRRDTAIASITESLTKGYWQKGDTLREIVKQKRQTENIKSEFNFASVGRILNFYDDEIKFVGYTFVGPAAVDALEYYDYKLLKTRGSQGREIFEIRMIPKSRTTPLFEGIISVAGESYALAGIDVVPNDVFTLPFTTVERLRYRQQFGLYENSFWMPADIHIEAAATIGVMGFRIPPIGFSQTSVITAYSINTAIPDTIFRKPRLTVDSVATAQLDSALWQSGSVLPLTAEEQLAYTTLDSTQTLDVQFRPGGLGIRLGGDGGDAVSVLNLLDLSFNRVEGFHLGAKFEPDSIAGIIDLRTHLAYGFSDKRMKYLLGATLHTSASRRLGFGADVYRILDHRPDAGYYGVFYNSLTSVLVKNDYRDYHEAEGWRAFVSFRPGKIFAGRISFASEKHRSAQQNTDFSIFARGSAYRPNPPASERNLRSIAVELRLGPEPVPLDIVRQPGIELGFEYSDPRFAGSEFKFSRVNALATFSIPTIGRSLLFPASLSVRVAAGTSTGILPPQRLFSLESASSGFAPFGVFKAMGVREFTGERYVAVSAEHNFRSLPFLALGIPFLYKNNIEFVIHGGTGRTWFDRPTAAFGTDRWNRPISGGNESGHWYGEAGFGFNRIFDLIRADFTWRVSSPGGFRFSLGVANLF